MSQLATPIYTNYASVQVRLANKVQFQQDPNNLVDGELPNTLLNQLIVDAETAVEQELRSRYAIPFQSASKGTYAGLPDHTKRVIRMLCDMKAVQLVLKTDFGRGTHISGDAYLKDIKEEYELEMKRALGRDIEGENDKIDRFRRTPPLDDLLLAATNRAADDGYHGMIINTDQDRCGAEEYAKHQINNPARSYVGTLGLGRPRR